MDAFIRIEDLERTFTRGENEIRAGPHEREHRQE